MEVKILEHLRERDLESTSNVDADMFASFWRGVFLESRASR